MCKKLLHFVVGFLAIAFLSYAPNASALQLTELGPQLSDSSKIELNTPEDDLDFDVTFLDQNQTLHYRATVTNDESKDIEVTSIDFTSSTQPFIEYSYDGIVLGDVIPAGESRAIDLYIKTNDQPTSTTTEDFNFSLHYREYQPNAPPEDLSAPNTVDNIIFAAITLLALVVVFIIFVRKNGRTRNLSIIFALPLVGLLLLTNTVSATSEDDAIFSIRGKVRFINSYTLTINPNGGVYNNSTETITNTYRDGTEISLSTPSRETYNFSGWIVDGSQPENNTVKLTQNTTLTANWGEIYYNLTINPNGGSYNGSTETKTTSYRANTVVSLDTPTKTGMTFTNWTKGDSEYTSNQVTMTGDITLIANYEDIYFNVTVNPNGGSYNGSTSTYRGQIKYGDSLDLTSTTWENHEVTKWTKNSSNTLPANTESIQIFEDTDLVAHWQSTRFFDVTINPNGGQYKDSSDLDVTAVREGTDYTIDGDDPIREGYLFLGWILEDDSELPATTFTVERPIEIRANWMFIAARNERTQKLYPTITDAAAEAQDNDTITVLADFEEKATVNSKITLDLNGHTITGYLINNGTVTLLNGEINNYEQEPDTANPDGAAIINNGKLTLGIDDYQDDEDHVKSALVDNNYVRIIGSEVGLLQNGELYYYDGFIEGNIALQGGYNDSPWYRDTFDGVVVRHFPFVDHNNVKDCQHVALENSDNAVSKTTNNGEIYYYNLQDNINASIRTGYKMYAVRDFNAGYSITVPENADVTFDIDGYNLSLNDTITVDGKFTIEDGKTTVVTANNTDNITMPTIGDDTIITPNGSQITTVNYAGKISIPQTIINNGEFVVKNARIVATTANDTIENNGTLTMQAGMLGATSGYVTQTIAGSVYNLDDNSYLYSTSTSKAAVYNTLSNYTWTSGNVAGAHTGFQNYSGTNVTIKDATILGYNSKVKELTVYGIYTNQRIQLDNTAVIVDTATTDTDTCGYVYAHCTYGISGNVTLTNGSSVTVSAPSGSPAYGISGTATIQDSTVTVTAYSSATGISGTVNATNSTISATSQNNSTYGISSTSATLTNSNVSATTNRSGNYYAYGIYSSGSTSTFTITNSRVSSEAEHATSYGIYSSCSSSGSCMNAIVDGSTVTAHSGDKIATGVYGDSYSATKSSRVTLNSGTISASSDNDASYGIRAAGNTILGGKVEGGTYGIYGTGANPTVIGKNDGEIDTESPEILGGEYALYDGAVYFYDGVLRGETAYSEDTIKAIPDGATYHLESSADYDENCWLVAAEDYLQVGDQTYNSLALAYAAVTAENPTIKVIKDVAIEAALPESPADKTIILDLNGHSLTYTQTLINNGNMTITDSSLAKSGSFNNSNPNLTTIVNNATLTIDSAVITAKNLAIENKLTLTVNESKITTPQTVIQSTGTNNNNHATVTITNSEIESEGRALYNNSYSDVSITGSTVSVDNHAVEKTVYGIQNSGSYTTLTLDNTAVIVDTATTDTDTCGYVYAHCTYGISGNVTLTNGSSVTVSAPSGSPAYGISGTATIQDSTVTVTAYSSATGVSGTVNATNSTISATSQNNSTYGISSTSATLTNSNVSATTNRSGNYYAYGIYSSGSTSTFTITNSRVSSEAEHATSYGIYSSCSSSGSCMNAIVDGSTVTAHSGDKIATGVYGDSYSATKSSRVTLNSGTISASSDNDASYGIRAAGNTILGGKVEGGTYGIYGTGANPTVIGKNDGEIDTESPEILGGEYALYDGAVYFYDGVLRGETAYSEDTIKAIPDGATYHLESSADYDENCWLVAAEDYLQVGDQTYNSLALAYAAVTAENPTIKVIKDVAIEAALPESPADKTIILDLNGHSLTYTQTLINNGNMTITDSSLAKSGSFNNSNPNLTTIVNNATLTIDSAVITAKNLAIENKLTLTVNESKITTPQTVIQSTGTNNNNHATVTITNSEIESEGRALYNNSYSDVSITGSTVSVDNHAVEKTVYGIQNSGSYTTLTLDNTAVIVDTATTDTDTCGYVYAHCTYGISGNVTLTNGSSVTVSAPSGSPAYGISGTATIQDSTVTVTAYSSATGVSGTVNATNSTISATSQNNSTYGISSTSATLTNSNVSATTNRSGNYYAYGIYSSGSTSTFTITNSRVSSEAEHATSYGIYSSCSSSGSCMNAIVDGSTVTAHSGDKTATGVYGDSYSATKSSRVTLNSGTISASSDNDASYGIRAAGNTILGGKVEGGTYGIYGTGANPTVIGKNDGEIDTESPEILGGEYALYDGAVYFYDGVLRGGIEAYREGVVKTIADNATIHTETQTINEKEYQTRYLVVEHYVAQINDNKYLKLSDAITAAEDGDVINLIDENHIFAKLEIENEKNFIIQTNGYGIHTGHQIVNNGKVSIINNTPEQTTIEYTPNEYFIVNNAGGELAIKNIKIDSVYGINNAGALNLEKIEINASNTAIKNTGNISAENNIILTGTSYPIYNDGGESIIQDVTLTGNQIYNNSGSLTLKNGSTERSGNRIQKFITNNGTLILDSFTATLTNIITSSNSSNGYAETIYNTGTLSVINNSTIRHIAQSESYSFVDNVTTIYNDGGNTNIENSTIIADSTGLRSHSYATLGVYNPSGSTTVITGTIESLGKNRSYGIWNDSGNVTIGEAEPVDSVNYGGEFADVSTSNPSIKATTTSTSSDKTAIAVKNNTGKVFFYDGKITGQTAAMPENPAGVEYLYEPKDYTDENGYQYRILEWMREQPGIQP